MFEMDQVYFLCGIACLPGAASLTMNECRSISGVYFWPTPSPSLSVGYYRSFGLIVGPSIPA